MTLAPGTRLGPYEIALSLGWAKRLKARMGERQGERK